MARLHKTAFVEYLFYGNYFYGICAVALSVEAGLQQRVPLHNIIYYSFIFAATVFFYTIAYLKEKNKPAGDKRAEWYMHNNKLMRASQVVLAVYIMVCLGMFLKNYYLQVWRMSLLQWALVIFFPMMGALYYGIDTGVFKQYNLRKIGWLKPFLIGFVWAGIVTIYPIIFYNITNQLQLQPTLIGCLLFLKNGMFITVLCIMFDIKDQVADYYLNLNTIIVKVGLRKTIFNILMPLCLLGFITFMIYGVTHNFSVIKICINTIPFIALVLVAYSLHRRRSLIYYLTIVDGLMLLKAICGTIAMIYF